VTDAERLTAVEKSVADLARTFTDERAFLYKEIERLQFEIRRGRAQSTSDWADKTPPVKNGVHK
jgi:hypothetical protein